MNIKKVLSRIFLGMCCVTGVTVSSVVLSACKTEVNETQEFTVTFNTLGGSSVDSKKIKDGEKVTKPDNPTREGYTFKYWSLSQDGAEYDFNTPITADTTLYAVWEKEVEVPPVVEDEKYTVTFDTVGGNVIDSIEVEKDGKVTKPADPTKEGYIFKHWSLTENGEAYDFNTQVTSNITLYAVWEEETEVPPVVETETLTRTLDVTITDLATDTSGKTINDEVVGYFTLGKGMKLEGDCINTQGKSITFTTTSAGVLTIVAEGASSNSNSDVSIVDGEGNSTHLDTLENKVRKNITWNIPAAGTYIVEQSKSIRVFSMSYTETVEKSEPSAIEVSTTGTTNFLVGDEFNSNGLNVTLVYENGRTEVVTPQVTVLTSEQMNQAGQYDVKVSYTINEQTFESSYKVNVYDVDSISLSTHDYDGNNTLLLQKVFLVGDTFNYDNLVVIAHGKLVVGEEIYAHNFILSKEQYTVSTPDLTKVGNSEVTVTSNIGEKTAAYTINVVNNVIEDSISNNTITVNVSNDENVVVEANNINFNSINDALKYLEICDVSDDVTKVINIAAGTYNEKVDVILPNVHFVGETTVNVENNTYDSQTIITYGAYNGLTVPSGNGVYSTDGSATVSIRESAYGFNATGISFANDINTLEEFNELKNKTDDTQAVALLVQADMAHFNNCYFTGYQDTLYAQVGRQYYENCYIEGRTDYIFGYDATAVFTNSVINHLPSPEGDANKNGGYIVATKGSEALNYGYIFDNCKFIKADGVIDGTVSIGRGWDSYMTIMVMNSYLDSHISKEAYKEVTADSEVNKNDRYGNMNADPDASRLLEYNNNGAGAITESLAGTCTVYNEENKPEAYLNAEGKLDLVKVFGKDTNGVNYTNDWTAGKVEYNVTISYYDGDKLITTGKDYLNTTLDSILTPEDKEGYRFVAWYIDKDLTIEFDKTTVLTSDISLYAKWESESEVQTDIYTYDVASIAAASYTSNFVWGTDGIVTVLAAEGKAVVVENNSKEFEGVTYTQRMKLGGSMSDTSRAIQIDLSKYSVAAQITIDVIVTTGSSGAVRPLVIENSNHEEQQRIDVTDQVSKATFNVTGGQVYYIGSASSGQNVYGLTITVVD